MDNRLNFNNASKMSLDQKNQISEMLCNNGTPVELQREGRSLKYMAKWKGLEYRNFLNYYGLAVLSDESLLRPR